MNCKKCGECLEGVEVYCFAPDMSQDCADEVLHEIYGDEIPNVTDAELEIAIRSHSLKMLAETEGSEQPMRTCVICKEETDEQFLFTFERKANGTTERIHVCEWCDMDESEMPYEGRNIRTIIYKGKKYTYDND